MEEQTINQEILKKLNEIKLEIDFIKERMPMEEIELTDWAKNELEEARKDNETISHEELKKELGL